MRRLLHYKSKRRLQAQIFVRKVFLKLAKYDGCEKTVTTQDLKVKTIYNQKDMRNKQRHTYRDNMQHNFPH